jgi:hypothetical protein
MRAIIINIGIEFGHCRRSTGSCNIAKKGKQHKFMFFSHSIEGPFRVVA